MEDDKIAFLEEFGLKLDKQRKIIRSLQNEKDALNEDLVVVTCANQCRKDEKIILRINNLVDELQKFKTILKKKREEINELEVQIRKVSSYIVSHILFLFYCICIDIHTKLYTTLSIEFITNSEVSLEEFSYVLYQRHYLFST